MTDPSSNDAIASAQDRALREAWVPTPPRRTDAAFARSVSSAVAERKGNKGWVMSLSLAAVATGALVFLLFGQTQTPNVVDTPSGERFALDLRATADAVGDEAATSLTDAALLAMVQSTTTGAFDAVSATDPSGYAVNPIDDGIDVAAFGADDDDEDEDDEDGEDAIIDIDDADDSTLLAMADLFAVPADSPYKF